MYMCVGLCFGRKKKKRLPGAFRREERPFSRLPKQPQHDGGTTAPPRAYRGTSSGCEIVNTLLSWGVLALKAGLEERLRKGHGRRGKRRSEGETLRAALAPSMAGVDSYGLAVVTSDFGASVTSANEASTAAKTPRVSPTTPTMSSQLTVTRVELASHFRL